MATSADIKKLRAPYMFDIGSGDLGNEGEFDPYQFSGPPSTFERQPAEQVPIQDPRASVTAPQQGPPPTKMGVGTYGNIDPAAMAALINQFYTPDTTSRDRFNKLLDEFPQQNKPGIARKLVASGLSIKAQDPIATAEKVLYEPFLRDTAIWKEKAGPFQQAAQLENTANINERTLAGNVVNAQTQSARIAEQERVANEKNRIAEMRAKTNDFKARGYTIKVLGDEVVGFSPDGKRVSLGSSGGVDEAEKIRLEGEWDVKAAQARGAAAVQTAQAGATAGNRDIVTQDNVTYKRNPDGSFSPVQGLPSGTPTRPGTPARGAATSQLEKDRVAQAEMLRLTQEYPEEVADIIIRADNGKFEFAPRPTLGSGKFLGMGTGVTQDKIDQWDKIKKEIDPSYIAPPTKSNVPPPTSTGKGVGPSSNFLNTLPDTTKTNQLPPNLGGPAATSQQSAPAGRVVLQDAQGRKFTLPANQVDSFLASPQGRGYQRAR